MKGAEMIMNRKRRIVSLLILMAVLFSCFTVPGYGASSKIRSMKTYDVIKKGKYVYVAGGKGIYRINITNKEKKTVTKKNPYHITMHLYKGYIYYLTGFKGEHFKSELRRVKLSNHKDSLVYRSKMTDLEYAIKKSTIYIYGYKASGGKIKKKINLSGSKKKKTKVKAVNKEIQSNANGYKLKFVYKYKGIEEFIIRYLVTPKWKLKIDRASAY